MANRVLFVHDGPMYQEKDTERYFSVHYTNELVNRYTLLGESVTFLMRKKQIGNFETKQYTHINHPSFNFIEVPNFKSIKTYLNKKRALNIIDLAVQNSDIVIVRLPSAYGAMAKKIAEKIGKPVLVEVVACVFDALWNYGWKGKLLAHYKMFRNKSYIKNSSHVIYVTEQFLQKRYPTTGKSIACSDVILSATSPEILNKRIAKINSDNDKIIEIGTVAALDVPYKRQADVIYALHYLKKMGYHQFRYNIVGQGSPDKLITLSKKLNVSDQINIIGPLKHEEVFNYLDFVDVYIQPSKQEGLPRAVIEAMSRGCLVYASKIAGNPELLGGEYLFEAGNIKQIAKYLRLITKHKLLYNAEFNFTKAKLYEFDYLNKKRKEFYREFMSDNNLL